MPRSDSEYWEDRRFAGNRVKLMWRDAVRAADVANSDTGGESGGGGRGRWATQQRPQEKHKNHRARAAGDSRPPRTIEEKAAPRQRSVGIPKTAGWLDLKVSLRNESN